MDKKVIVLETKEELEEYLQEFNSNNRTLDTNYKIDVSHLIALSKNDSETAGLIKQLVNLNRVDTAQLADRVAKEIISDIEIYVENHLEKYQKYTLDAPTSASYDESNSQFFNLISLLKDVSILGRRLLESAPQFNVQKRQPPQPLETSMAKASSTSPSTRKVSTGMQPDNNKNACDEDATSEDLLAALIESSSSDDFLVLSSSLDSISVKDMIMAALIYIKSHDCFTLSHDIQGVVMVLRRTKFMIINILAPKDQKELITKLLTSIGRYREMNYVFDLFRDRNQFETLLSKGVEKTSELRIALFNYVKKNPEFYALVTLNFSMFCEIAESLEGSALKRLKKTVSSSKIQKVSSRQEVCDLNEESNKSIGSSSEQASTNVSSASSMNTSTGIASINIGSSSATNSNRPRDRLLIYPGDSLNLSLIELIDASDCFAKAGCYKKSNYCERKAKLIALQLALLPTGTNVLELAQSELSDLIVNFHSFNDAFILAEAYDCQLAWRQALFKNVILDGKLDYLDDYCKKCDLSSALVEELVLLYKKYINSHQLSQEVSSNLAKAMKRLLIRLANVELKCKIYTQLNLVDAKEELLQDPAVEAHLKDLRLA